MEMTWLQFTVLGLATYRLALMLSSDSGPFRLLARFRSFLRREEKHNKALRKSDVAAGMDCVRCNSVWIAAPIAAYAFCHGQLWPWLANTGDIFLLAKALSAIAILVNRIPKR